MELQIGDDSVRLRVQLVARCVVKMQLEVDTGIELLLSNLLEYLGPERLGKCRELKAVHGNEGAIGTVGICDRHLVEWFL